MKIFLSRLLDNFSRRLFDYRPFSLCYGYVSLHITIYQIPVADLRGRPPKIAKVKVNGGCHSRKKKYNTIKEASLLGILRKTKNNVFNWLIKSLIFRSFRAFRPLEPHQTFSWTHWGSSAPLPQIMLRPSNFNSWIHPWIRILQVQNSS
jgi:hypothetical protein